jgi:hypothetical protein
MQKNYLTRTEKEMRSLFEDKKFARQAWKSLGNALLQRPAAPPITDFDKDDNETFNSKIQNYTYTQLSKDLKLMNSDRTEPSEIEMILACQMIKARTDTAAATFIRDTLGAKPVDESKMDMQVNNPYESLSDEELELLAKHRETKQLQEPNAQLTQGE